LSPARVALVAPRMATEEEGGAEVLFRALRRALNEVGARADLVEIATDESDFEAILRSYSRCYDLRLDEYDLVISTKAPTFMVRHRNHVSLLVHTVRVFYDRFEAEHPNPSGEQLEQRARIRELDLGAFSGGLVRERFVIGEPVAQRLVDADPRWRDLPFRRIDLPPRFPVRAEAASSPGEHFLLPGRLHRWKRVDLAIRAVRRLPGDTPLLVVGTGEDEERFRDAAGGDPRIRFRGRVEEAELEDLYARCIAVPFVPVQEDYGFVTVEAFAHGRPVVTCGDSGRPATMVAECDGGLVAEPTPESVAAALAALRDDAPLARRLGENGRVFAGGLSWTGVARTLLAAGGIEAGSASAAPAEPEQVTLAVFDNQPIDPPVGGRVRLYGLYRTLDPDARAIYVGSYDWRGPGRRTVSHPPRLEERTIPHSEEHFAAADRLAELCGAGVIDVTQPLLAVLSDELLAEARRALDEADIAVFTHPWMYPPLADDVRRRGVPVVYDSHNMEWRLRRDLLSGTPFGRALVHAIRFWEGELCRRADLVLACSEDDRRGFVEEYGADPDRVVVLPNGTHPESIVPAGDGAKGVARAKLGLPADDPIAVFIGSGYGPNVDAAEFIAGPLARELPGMRFLIAGGVGDLLAKRGRPRNAIVLGPVDDAGRLAAFHAADFAVNPMARGSGTNVKMLDFLAAGLPVVSTPVGARGIVAGDPPAFWTRGREEFAASLQALAGDPGERAALGRRARSLAEREYDWRALSARFAGMARDLARRRTPSRAARPPAVSVVVPSFDRPERLARLLERLSRQTLRDFEVIVVEQGTGSTLPRELRLRHVVTPVRGAVRARNTGIALARAELIAFVDDDCLPEPGWLEAIVTAFGDPSVVGVEGVVRPDRPDASPSTVRIVSNEGFEGYGFMTANFAVRAAAARRLGGFDEIFDHPHFREDTDFGWRLTELGEVPSVPGACVVHPVLPREDDRESAAARARFFEKDPVLFEKHPTRYPGLFATEEHYARTEGFWDAFRRGLEKYGARIDAAAIVAHERVVRSALPDWFVRLAD